MPGRVVQGAVKTLLAKSQKKRVTLEDVKSDRKAYLDVKDAGGDIMGAYLQQHRTLRRYLKQEDDDLLGR